MRQRLDLSNAPKRMAEETPANYINHVGIVADMSASMRPHADNLVKAVDALVAHLAQRSKDLDQETRITFYTFNYTTKCVFYDKDVLRLPSIKGHYFPDGRTALRDATSRAIQDMLRTATIYGDHAFLLYALTDGWENESHLVTAPQLNKQITSLPDNWTVAGLVPNSTAKFDLKGVGFPAGNIELWDTTTSLGLEEAASSITRSADTFMTNRAAGVRGTTNLFSTDASVLNRNTIYAAGLGEVAKDTYFTWHVDFQEDIRPFVERKGAKYVLGNAYYQLNKTETIQPHKQILVRDKKDGKVYSGPHARELIGLKGDAMRVTPTQNPQFDVFVQSRSVNRKLVPGTMLIYMKG